jgi:Ca2+:H+ antiporter
LAERCPKIDRGNRSLWIRKTLATAALLVSTGLISVCGGILVESIDHFVDHSPLSKTMVGLIILPLVGNASELVSGIMFASRKQMDLAFAVSIGSAIQIGLFVTPLMVVIGWVLGLYMTLHFTVFEAVTLIASTALFCGLVLDDKSSMLKGVSLFAGYTVIA